MQTISVIVPKNPFVKERLRDVKHCLAALDVEQLMDWWPGRPHTPHRDSNKVRAIQRSLDWKRVTQIAAYLLQEELVDAPGWLDTVFSDIYQPKANDPGRQWPPKVPKVVGYQPSVFPMFSNVLLHVNGATLNEKKNKTAELKFDDEDKKLNFAVIDGQHRINGAFLAVMVRKQNNKGDKWDIPADIFIDLDKSGKPPRNQAQIFIDVNFYQKKVDLSLVADLFPTARGPREALGNKERAQDLGRKLMLETGPLVGMIQIPGIKFGVSDVVTLATLNSAIEKILDDLVDHDLGSLEEQSEFIALCLDAWLDATRRREDLADTEKLDTDNVVYQGRVLVSFLTLVPACMNTILKKKQYLISDEAYKTLSKWLHGVLDRAGLLKDGKFITRNEFKRKGYLGSGGLGRFRDMLWAAAFSKQPVKGLRPETIANRAKKARASLQNGH